MLTRRGPASDKASFDIPIPSCLADTEYLFRIEHVALHEAFIPNGMQFYVACAQLSVSGGSGSATPSDLVAFPGAYKATDPGLFLSIYYNFKSYTPAGPAVFTCDAGSEAKTEC